MNAAVAEWKVQILSMNAAVWQMETPAGLPDVAYHTAFQVFSTCNPAESECVFDSLLVQSGEIRCHFRPLHCSIWRNRSAFSTVYLLNAAKSNGISDRLLVKCGEWEMKNGGICVQITVFAAGKLGNVIAMRAFRRVFRLFSCLFDD